MGPPCDKIEVIVYSSRLFDAIILQSSIPALSNIFRACFAKYAKSPESNRIPFNR